MSEVTIATLAGGIDFGSAVAEQSAANEAQQFREQQIRSQQVQLRLQDAQQSVAEQQKLRQTIATTMVQAGSRGISSSSASIRAIFEHDYSQYDQDKDARRLNLSEKELGLNFEDENSRLMNEAQTTNIWSNFAQSAAKTGLMVEGGVTPSIESQTAGTQAASSSSNLIPDINKV